MKLILDALPSDDADRIRSRLRSVLAASRWRKRSRWSQAIIVQTPERFEVLHRAVFAEELRAAGLVEAAHEATARTVKSGAILCYVLEDREDRSGVAFVVVALLGGAR